MSFFSGLESCVSTVTYNSSAFLEDISSPLRGNLVLMLKKLKHFIFIISGEMDQDCFTTVPVKDSVQAVQLLSDQASITAQG